MRTLHIIGSRELGGAERFFLRLVNALAARGEHVAALTATGSALNAWLASGVERHQAPMLGLWDFWSRFTIRQTARRFQLVQTYMGRATRLTHLPAGSGLVHVARLGGYYNLKGYRHAHAWIGNTRGICDYLVREGLPADRVYYIGNFVDPAPEIPRGTLDELRAQWSIPQEAQVVLGLGRLHPNKGFDVLLAAFARLPPELKGRPLWLAMVGEGPERGRLLAIARQLGVAERVVWAGWQHDPAPWYQMAELFVCPSRHEPLGNVILEAWANGVTVVSTAAQGPQELIEPGVNGLLSPVDDVDALAESILSVLRLDEKQRAALVAAGKDKLERDFSETAIVGAYQALYRQLLG